MDINIMSFFKNNYKITLYLSGILIIVGALAYMRHEDNNAVDVSLSAGNRPINVSQPLKSYDSLADFYKTKTQHYLTRSRVSSQLNYEKAEENAKNISLNHLLAEPATAIFRNYQLEGSIVQKVQTNSRPVDYITVITKAGLVRIYFYSDLPYEEKGAKVRVTGIVLGRPLSNPNDMVSFVSTDRHVERLDKIGK